LKSKTSITVYEHDRLTTDNASFNHKHLNALLKLNEYHNFDYFDPIPNGVKFKQYVGIIQVDGLSIEILPKADKDNSSADWKGLLLQMLKACGHLKASSAGSANVKRQHLNLLEVYFELYLTEIEILIHRGLVKKYRKKTGNVKALKGKLEFAGNIRHNLVHKERFFTTHQVYDYDHLLHQTLAHALEILEQFCKGSYLFDRCKRVLLNFPEITPLKVTKKQLEGIVLNRKTAPYSQALELARLIILNYSPDISTGREKMISLLFDMNRLWEEFILIQIRKELAGTSYSVKGQDSQTFIGSNYLKPDIVIQHDIDSKKVYIIDTKWKRPQNKSSSISDLRQMYAYNRFWKAQKAMLLYPGESKNTSFNEFKTEDFFRDNDQTTSIIHMCKSGFVSILDDDNKLSDTIGKQVLDLLEEDFD
jgi:5-methylcytosine-specific restriction enzyme subunit McrC